MLCDQAAAGASMPSPRVPANHVYSHISRENTLAAGAYRALCSPRVTAGRVHFRIPRYSTPAGGANMSDRRRVPAGRVRFRISKENTPVDDGLQIQKAILHVMIGAARRMLMFSSNASACMSEAASRENEHRPRMVAAIHAAASGPIF